MLLNVIGSKVCRINLISSGIPTLQNGWRVSLTYWTKNEDDMLEQEVEALIDEIEKNQDESGYFNIYFTVIEPENRFKRRTDHELYCAGHLIEAAVAYYETTKRDRF